MTQRLYSEGGKMTVAQANILFLFSDQHRADAMGCAGHPVVRTPNLDRLAGEGVRFGNAYCATPLCMPSRVSLATGRFPHNTGNNTNNEGYLYPDTPMISHAFRDAGYRTALLGKLHLCQAAGAGSPACDDWCRAAGYDEFMPIHGKAWSCVYQEPDFDAYLKWLATTGKLEAFRRDYRERSFGWMFPDVIRKPHGYAAPSVLEPEDHQDGFITRKACEWLEQADADQPFFCWVNWGGPHDPWDAPGEFGRMYDPAAMPPPIADALEDAPEKLRKHAQKHTGGMPDEAWRAVMAQYYGSISFIDDGIGKILDVLDKRGLLTNTIVVYASDHGEMMFDHQMLHKEVMYEPSSKVPLIIRLPGGILDGWDSGNAGIGEVAGASSSGTGSPSTWLGWDSGNAGIVGHSEERRTWNDGQQAHPGFQPQGRTITAPVSLLDLVPTLLDLAGVERQAMPVLHGTTLLPDLRGETRPERPVFSEMNHTKMIRQGSWKYSTDPDFEIDQLFNLDEDPHELLNLAAHPEHAERVNGFRKALLDWLINTQNVPMPRGVAGASSSGERNEARTPAPEQDAPATMRSGTPDWSTLTIKQGDNLPHWTCEAAIYHVSFRLSDSVPSEVREAWIRERDSIIANAAQFGRPLSDDEEKRLQHLYSEKIERFLDAGHGVCHMNNPAIADLVANALRHFDGGRYCLHAWSVMPNHVHVVVEPFQGQQLGMIVHSWKSFTANEANKALKLTGQFWQHEPYDHIIRSEREYRFQVDYVWGNPDKAGLTHWQWRRRPNVAGASSSG